MDHIRYNFARVDEIEEIRRCYTFVIVCAFGHYTVGAKEVVILEGVGCIF